MTTAIANIDPDQLSQNVSFIVSTIERHQVGTIGHSLAIAQGIRKLQSLLNDDVMNVVMELQGTSIGFRTDKDDSGGYPVHVVKDIVTAALVKGARITGNEINIIANQLYLTRDFYLRVLSELPGLTDLKVELALPELRDGFALIAGRASWVYQGRRDSITFAESGGDTRIAVKRNKGQDHAAVATKGDRKIRQRVYERIMGTVTTVDADDAAVNVAANARPAAAIESTPAATEETAEAVQESLKLCKDIAERIENAQSVDALELCREEVDNAKQHATNAHWKRLRDKLNERYRVINNIQN